MNYVIIINTIFSFVYIQAISLSIFQCKLIKYVNKSNKCKQTTCWDIEKLNLKILKFIYFFKYINT